MNILKDLHNTIKKVILNDSPFTTTSFMMYILEPCLPTKDNSDSNRKKYSNTMLHNIYENKKRPSNEILNKLVSSGKWSFSHLIEYLPKKKQNSAQKSLENLIEEMKKLQNKYSITCMQKQNFSYIMRSLILFHFFGTTEPEKLFVKDFPSSCSNYVPWTDKEEELNKQLKKSSVVFITGSAGSGKRQLIIHATEKDYLSHSSDFYWLDIDNDLSLRNELLKIKFWGEKKDYFSILQTLRSKNSSSLLVIRKAILEDTDLAYIKTTLCKMNLRIIISTYTKISDDDGVSVDLDCRPLKNLKKIFEIQKPTVTFNDDEFKKLANNVSNNVYALFLIGKALSINSKKLEKERLLENFESLYQASNMPKMHSSYHDNGSKSGQQLFNLLDRFLDFYPDVNSPDNELSKLSIWAKTPISKAILTKYAEKAEHWDAKKIENWIRYGILQYYNDEKVYMPNLIADTIWRRTALNYQEYINNIKTIFQSIACGKRLTIPYTDLYEIIFQALLRLHYRICTVSSRMNKEEKITTREWNLFLTEMIQYYMKLGNSWYAQQLLPHLYILHNKKEEYLPKSEMQSFIQEFLSIQAEYMQSSDMNTGITSLITLLKNNENLSAMPNDSQLFLDIFTFLLKDLGDCAIENTCNYIEKLISQNEKASQNYLVNVILTLQQIGNLLLRFHLSNGTFNEHYYLEICKRIFHLFKSELTIQEDLDYFSSFDMHKSVSDENFKTNCARLYFFLSSILLGRPELMRNLNFTIIERHFTKLYELFQENIWSYHTAWMFYSCASLLTYMYLNQTIYPFADNKQVCEILIDCMERYKNFISVQISLPESQKNSYDTAIEKMLYSLKDFLQQSSESVPE